MKEYATLSTHRLAEKYDSAVSYSAPLINADHLSYLTIQDLTERGWVVISSAISAPNCAHGDAKYHFLLERDTEISQPAEHT